jgi:hypothetical protein
VIEEALTAEITGRFDTETDAKRCCCFQRRRSPSP